jgi:hypothetical protein
MCSLIFSMRSGSETLVAAAPPSARFFIHSSRCLARSAALARIMSSTGWNSFACASLSRSAALSMAMRPSRRRAIVSGEGG